MTETKVAVTGASGFIGRHVVKELLSQGAEVTAITRDAARLANVKKKVQVVELDISRPETYNDASLQNADILIHLAWDGLPNYDSLRHFETELPSQYLFLKTLIEAGLPALLVAGTCYEYGMQSGELSEELPSQPSNPYGYAKDALRRQLELLGAEKSFALTWARLFYMYGEGQAESSIFSQLRKAVQRGDKVFHMSGGEQIRDYMPVREVASSLVTLALRKVSAGIINVSSGKPISVRNLVEGWIKKNGWSIKLNLGHYPYPTCEPMTFWGNSSKCADYLSGRSASRKESKDESRN